MGENEKKLCSFCGSEMQEYRGKYFCLECGSEYKTVTDDSGEEKIVLVSGRYEKKTQEPEEKVQEKKPREKKVREEKIREKEPREEKDPRINNNENSGKTRETLIGVLLGIAILAVIVGAWSLFGKDDSDKMNNNNQTIADNIKDEEEEEPIAEEEAEIKEEEPSPSPSPATPTPTPKPTETPKKEEDKPQVSEQPSNTETPSEGTLYRVRKSADDAKTQIGAYRNLDSAKKEADANKADGYKVYDRDGNLVYKP